MTYEEFYIYYLICVASASDIAQNPVSEIHHARHPYHHLTPVLCHIPQYWKRDARRNYPQLSVVTQTELSQLLLGVPQQPAFVSFLMQINPFIDTLSLVLLAD